MKIKYDINMKIKSGFEFLITKNNYTGHVLFTTTDDFYKEVALVMFFNTDGSLYKICTVYIQTIINNLKDGTYKETKRK